MFVLNLELMTLQVPILSMSLHLFMSDHVLEAALGHFPI